MGILTFVFTFLFSAGQISEFLVPIWFDPGTHTEKVNQIEYEGITLLAENLEVTGNHLGFDIEVLNQAGHRIRLEEGNLFILTSDIPFPSDENMALLKEFESGLEKKYPLEKPEVTTGYVKEIERYKRKKVFLGLLSVGLIAFDIGMDLKDIKRPEWTRKNEFNTEIRKLLTMGGLTATSMGREKTNEEIYNVAEDLTSVDTEIFQFIDLASDSFIRGKVYFPLEKKKYFRLIFIVSDVEYVLDFRWANYKDMKKLKQLGYIGS